MTCSPTLARKSRAERPRTWSSRALAPIALGLLAAPSALAQGADDCGSAQAIAGVGTFSIDTRTATPDGPSFCGLLTNEVWFAWTAPTTDNYEFTTCSFADYDTALALYSGTCGALSLESCNDDSCGLRSLVGVSAMAGQTYLLQAGGYSGDRGTATLEVRLGGTGSGGCMNPATGPDVIVGAIPSISNYGSTPDGMAGYSLGTTSCNTGDVELLWISNTTDHPVIGQNIYRLENGRFEQVGMSWLKHGFFALQGNLCCTCSPAANGSTLGVGCSDPYGSGLNGSQGGLGPRFEVNAYTGGFSFPYFAQGQTGDRAFKRIQIPNDDVSPALHPTAEYFGEAQYVTPDDAAAGNGFNNVSWVRLSRPGGETTGAWTLNIGGSTVQEEPAIRAWEDSDPSVTVVDVNVSGEGQFVAGSNAIDNGDGTWRYEYAIFNNNSDLSGQRFSVRIGAGVNVTDVGMSFPHYHSGEPYTNEAWTSGVAGGAVTWETEAYADNPDANALRWGTTYSFWFTADAGPQPATASLGLFKPGGPGDQLFTAQGPMDGGGGVAVNAFCAANANSTGLPSRFMVTGVDMTARTADLLVTDLPSERFGIFIASQSFGFMPAFGGGLGNVCVVGSVGRELGGTIFNSGIVGQVSATADLDLMPTPTGFVSVMPGETWYLQWWHRDEVLGQTSNLSNAIEIQFP